VTETPDPIAAQSAAKVTGLLGDLDVIFERIVGAGGARLWNIPYRVGERSRPITLYITEGWLVALHRLNAVAQPVDRGVELLELNARLLGARIAVSAGVALVLADAPIVDMTARILGSLLQSVLAAAEQTDAILARTQSAEKEPDGG
jgi:hypothetical protein